MMLLPTSGRDRLFRAQCSAHGSTSFDTIAQRDSYVRVHGEHCAEVIHTSTEIFDRAGFETNRGDA